MRLKFKRHLRLWRREAGPTVSLALPIMAGMVSQTLMGLADTVMVGRVGVTALAACALVNTVAHIPLVFGLGLLTSIAVLAAQAFGARRAEDAGEVLRHGLLLSCGMGLLAALSLILFRSGLRFLGQPQEVVEASGDYLIFFALSLIPGLIAHGCKQFSEALKHPWPPTLVLLGGVVLNVFLNWVFIYGNLGISAMRLEGAGLATLIARSVMLLALLAYVLRASALRAFQPARWRSAIDRSRIAALVQLGWPVALQHVLEVGAFASAALMMGWISAAAIAAHQIAITCAATTFMFALGIGMAVCIRVGHAYGARQFSRIRRIGYGGVALAAGIMSLFGATFMLAGGPIAHWFIDAPEVVQLAAALLGVAAVFQVADGIQIASICALRGLGDVRIPAVIAAMAYWLVALPVGSALAFAAGLGAVGIWVGLAAGLCSAALGLSVRFHRHTGEAQFATRRSAEDYSRSTAASDLGVPFPSADN